MKTILIPFLLFFLVISGCAQTVGYGRLKSNQDNPSDQDLFHQKIGVNSFSVIFEYSADTGLVSIKDISLKGVDEADIDKIYDANKDLLAKEKKVIDCVSIAYAYNNDGKDDKATFSACKNNKNPKVLSLFNKNQVIPEGVIRGTILLPFAGLALVFGNPDHLYEDAVRLKVDEKAIQDFGRAVLNTLGKEAYTSCKTTDTGLSAYRYQGECSNGFAHGHGTAVGRDKYIGEFRNGNMNGKGEYFWANGDYYQGDFVDNHLTGKGSFKWVGGGSYEGDVVDSVRTGHGKYTYSDGRVDQGFFLASRLLSESEYVDYRLETDPEFARQYRLEEYRNAFNAATSPNDFKGFISKYETNDPAGLIPKARVKMEEAVQREVAEAKALELQKYRDAFNASTSSSDFKGFISKYEANDPDALIPKARVKMEEAVQRELAEAKARALQKYRDQFSSAKKSYEYEDFIDAYLKNDPDNLVPKAKSLKSEALKREKAEYDSVMDRNWSSNFKVKVTFTTAPGKAVQLLDQVTKAVKVRDPGGIFNPYWVTNVHASAAYNDKGVVIGEWYTGYYDGWSDWSNHAESELKKLGVDGWHMSPMGSTSRPSIATN